jgi:xanthine dehydrogenase iron-sulfur cluster and FAD-binding subunit A
MWQTYLQPTSLDETLHVLHEHAGRARIVAGGTDVLVELQRGVRPTTTLIDITKLRDLKYVRSFDGQIQLGALATHNDIVASTECVEHALPLAQACWEVGAPQIRTRATVAGNLITASPANDTITPLMALAAEVVLLSVEGERVVPLRDFYPGFRRTAIKPNELLREIRVPALQANQRGLFLKLGLRRAQAISVIDVAFVLTFDGDAPTGQVSDAQITLGCLAPTIVHAETAEAFLSGQRLTPDVCQEAGQFACEDVKPIDDVRGSASYRRATLAALLAHGLQRIADGKEADGWPKRPVLLETQEPGTKNQERGTDSSVPFQGIIKTTINGQPYQLEGAQNKSLLNALRENAGLTGTKEGCAEGECGACTVWLNGQAVMSCLVPAAQAHGATITTIEGLAHDGQLHPLQQAFINHAAVQCGYCIPGFLMAGSKLLEEIEQPSLEQVQIALSGNLCRCTGYRKILDAVLDAGGMA